MLYVYTLYIHHYSVPDSHVAGDDMAELGGDIEYEGIADGRSIRVGSERCFRDYSPSETILSLSDDGRAT